MYDLIIIGGGAAGLAAAMYAGRLNMKTLVLSKEPGGAIILTDVIENWPGEKSIQGMELAQKLEEHALEYGVKIINEEAVNVKKCEECFKVNTQDNEYHAKSIIFATGTKHRGLNVKGEEKFKGKGVHVCALCDGPFYKGKDVVVAGGGDSAVKEAILLTQYASKVYIIVRGEKIRAEPINIKRLKKNEKIEVILGNQVVEIKGNGFVSSVVLKKGHKGKKEISTNAVFVEIGRIPLSGMAKELGVKLNDKNEIIINRLAETNVPGIFAAGDVANSRFKQAITGAGEGVTAAYTAYTYVNENEFICPCGGR